MLRYFPYHLTHLCLHNTVNSEISCDFYFENFQCRGYLRDLKFAHEQACTLYGLYYADTLLARTLNSRGKKFTNIRKSEVLAIISELTDFPAMLIRCI